MARFRWNDWNVEHIAEHGFEPEEAEYVVTTATPPYPSYHGDGKWLVRGQDEAGRYLQVIFVIDDSDDEDEQTLYVIHARPLTETEKRQLRRRRRR